MVVQQFNITEEKLRKIMVQGVKKHRSDQARPYLIGTPFRDVNFLAISFQHWEEHE